MPKLQQRVAKLNEYSLYALLLLQPLSGLGMTLFRGRPFALLFWRVPALLSPQPELSQALWSVHEVGAVVLRR
jgi:cytochrome b561